MKNLTGRPILATLLPPQNHQNPQQQKFIFFSDEHSRSRGVAKITFRIPMLHGSPFLFCFPCSVGVELTQFATAPQREGDFFIFLTHPQREARKS